MARKINVKLILELREAKLSRNQIADSRHIARNSVSDVFRIADERGITYSDIRSLISHLLPNALFCCFQHIECSSFPLAFLQSSQG